MFKKILIIVIIMLPSMGLHANEYKPQIVITNYDHILDNFNWVIENLGHKPIKSLQAIELELEKRNMHRNEFMLFTLDITNKKLIELIKYLAGFSFEPLSPVAEIAHDEGIVVFSNIINDYCRQLCKW